MATYSFRSDPELDAAFTQLGVTPNARNRTTIVRAAVLAYAAAQTTIPHYTLRQHPTNTGTRLIIDLNTTGEPQ